jgi:hypothetical protein
MKYNYNKSQSVLIEPTIEYIQYLRETRELEWERSGVTIVAILGSLLAIFVLVKFIIDKINQE